MIAPHLLNSAEPDQESHAQRARRSPTHLHFIAVPPGLGLCRQPYIRIGCQPFRGVIRVRIIDGHDLEIFGESLRASHPVPARSPRVSPVYLRLLLRSAQTPCCPQHQQQHICPRGFHAPQYAAGPWIVPQMVFFGGGTVLNGTKLRRPCAACNAVEFSFTGLAADFCRLKIPGSRQDEVS